MLVLEPGRHLGGMVTGGLSATDLGDFHIIDGYARDFTSRPPATMVSRSSTALPIGSPSLTSMRISSVGR